LKRGVVVAIFLLLLGYGSYQTYQRNASFIALLEDKQWFETRSNRSFSSIFLHLESQKKLLAIFQSIYAHNYPQAIEQIESLEHYLQAVPSAKRDMHYFQIYIDSYYQLISPIEHIQKEHNATFNLTLDEELFYQAIEKQQQMLQVALQSYDLSSELKESSLRGFKHYQKALIKAFRRDDRLQEFTHLLQGERINSDRVVLLIWQEFLLSFHLDAFLPLQQARQIKTSLVMLHTFGAMEETIKRYHHLRQFYR